MKLETIYEFCSEKKISERIQHQRNKKKLLKDKIVIILHQQCLKLEKKNTYNIQ